jgi:hypothetical protein
MGGVMSRSRGMANEILELSETMRGVVFYSARHYSWRTQAMHEL